MESQQVSPRNTKMGITWSWSISRLVIGKTWMSFTGLSTQRTTKTAPTMVKCFHRNSHLICLLFPWKQWREQCFFQSVDEFICQWPFQPSQKVESSVVVSPFLCHKNSWDTSCDAAAAEMSHLTFISETYVCAFCLICKLPFKKRCRCIGSCVLTAHDLKKLNT